MAISDAKKKMLLLTTVTRLRGSVAFHLLNLRFQLSQHIFEGGALERGGMSNSMDLNDGHKKADLVVRYVKVLLLFKIVFKIIIFNLIKKKGK